MHKDTFREIAAETLISAGFKKKGAYFFKRSPDAIASIHLQHSSYSNGYYICLGFLLCAIEPNVEFPKDSDCHIRSRFCFFNSTKNKDFFDLDYFQETSLQDCLSVCIEKQIPAELSIQGLREHLKLNPVLLYQTTQKAQQFLGVPNG